MGDLDIDNYGGYTSTPSLLKEEGPKKALWIALIIAFFMVIFIILFIASIQYSSKSISITNLEEGRKVEIPENKSLKFKFDEKKHDLLIEVIESNSVDIIIRSDTLKAHLVLGQTYFFDINNDSENDLRIRLESIRGNRAVIYIQRVDGDYCIENWKCSDWSDCFNRLRKRKCNDLSNCGNNKSKPNEEVFCMGELKEDSNESDFQEENLTEFIGNGELTCMENNATICSSSENCKGDFINSSDASRCCLGNCTLILINDTLSYIECNKDIRLFKEATDTCNNFSMNCSEKIIFLGAGLIRDFNSSFELKGYSNASCIFYYKYHNFSMNYSDKKIEELIKSGKSLEQINFEINSLNEGYNLIYAGNSITCYYLQKDLRLFLYKWETGKETWSLDLLGKYDCAGDSM